MQIWHQLIDDLRKNTISWLSAFAIWMSWEAAIRTYLSYPDSGVSYAILYLLTNIIFSLGCGIALGIAFTCLETLFFHRFLQPALSVAIAALISVLVLVEGEIFLYITRRLITLNWILFPLVALFLHGLFRPLLIWLTSRRSHRFWVWCGVVLFLLPACSLLLLQSYRSSSWSIVEQARGPIRRVILISIDTLRYDYVGAYGLIDGLTPTIDQIASEGALFEHAISPIPETGPSHTTMLTGLAPAAHGVWRNGHQKPRNIPTLVQKLRKAGFQTAAFVSARHLNAMNAGLTAGFQVYDDRFAWSDWINDTYFGTLAERSRRLKVQYYTQGKEVTDAALHWLKKNDGAPFFLFLHYFDVHTPYGIKDKILSGKIRSYVKPAPANLSIQKKYYAQEVYSVDQQIARIVRLLKEQGLYDDTLLIITADHGESLGEHNYYYDHVGSLYEQLIRVPMVIHVPLLIQSQTVVRQQVALLDLCKTILSATGVSSNCGPGTYDLIQLANGNSSSQGRVLFSHHPRFGVHSLRTPKWKLILKEKAGKNKFELYDLAADPAEIKNLFSSDPAVAAYLQKRMAQELAELTAGNLGSTRELTPEQVEALRSLGYIN